MSTSDWEKDLAELEKSFAMLGLNNKASEAYQIRKAGDEQWKVRDPEGYKKDMENMCKAVLGDDWLPAYEAMLREEFPEEFA